MTDGFQVLLTVALGIVFGFVIGIVSGAVLSNYQWSHSIQDLYARALKGEDTLDRLIRTLPIRWPDRGY